MTTMESNGPRRAMLGLAAFVVAIGVVSWLVSEAIGRRVPPPAADSLTVGTSPSSLLIEPDGGTLQALACVDAGDCWAVGAGATSGPLIMHYTLGGWAKIADADTGVGQLMAVTCVSAGNCWAVGGSVDASGVGRPLIDHYTGSRWDMVAAAEPSPDEFVVLNGVACASADDCWAVGDSADANVTRQLIEHYDGSRWVVSGNSLSPDKYVALNGVACAPSGDCWAVGSSGDANATRPLIEESTGSGWVIDAPVASPGPFVGLNAVTCISSDCWAVGSAGIGNPMLLEHLTGRAELISANSAEGVPLGVACGGARDCWSVGSSGQPLTGLALPQIAHFDRSTLAVDVAPNPFALMEGESSAVLNGVSCVSSADCWAVGSVALGNGVGTLIEQYEGRSWRVVRPLDRGP